MDSFIITVGLNFVNTERRNTRIAFKRYSSSLIIGLVPIDTECI